MKHALIIGVEFYKLGINRVYFATNDANAFKEAMLVNGCQENNVYLLVNEKATTSNIMAILQKLSYDVKENDELVFFFAGHGEIYNGRQFLITHDTSYSDIQGTAIPLDDLFLILRSFKRVTFFLDSCHSGMPISPLQRGRDTLDKDPFELLKDLEYQVAFASCKNGEKSYGSDKLQHGTWTYHVVQALMGEAPSSIYKPNGELPSTSLQEYLTEYVPSFVKQEHGDDKVQTPWLFGGFTRDFPVKQASNVPANEQHIEVNDPIAAPISTTIGNTTTNSPDNRVKVERFYKIQTGFVRDLSGFQKGSHKEPKYISKSTEDFVTKIAIDDIKEEIDYYLKQIVNTNLFKDSQIVVEYDELGCIDCNEIFYILVSVEQDTKNPRKYIMNTELMIHSNKLNEFLNILPNLPLRIFERIVYVLPYHINISEVLEILEQEKEYNINYNYTPGNDYLILTLDEGIGSLTLSENSNLLEFYSKNSSVIELYDELKIFLNSIGDEQIKLTVTGLNNIK